MRTPQIPRIRTAGISLNFPAPDIQDDLRADLSVQRVSRFGRRSLQPVDYCFNLVAGDCAVMLQLPHDEGYLLPSALFRRYIPDG